MSVLLQILQRPKLAYYYAQKGIRNTYWRSLLTKIVVRLVNLRSKGRRFPINADTETACSELKKNGIVFLPDLNLKTAQLDEIHTYFQTKHVHDMYSGLDLGLAKDVTPSYNKVNYKTADTLGCSQLMQLANNSEILSIAAQYLGAPPSIASMQTWWTIGEHNLTGQSHYDDIYHRDVDDLRFVKLFIYLTDTDEKSGAHSYIKKSHLSSKLVARGSISDEVAHHTFQSDLFATIVGSAGTIFLEDTWGIHRPLLATHGRRLIFSVLYSLIPWTPQSPPYPLLLLPEGLDAHVNRRHFSKQ